MPARSTSMITMVKPLPLPRCWIWVSKSDAADIKLSLKLKGYRSARLDWPQHRATRRKIAIRAQEYDVTETEARTERGILPTNSSTKRRRAAQCSRRHSTYRMVIPTLDLPRRVAALRAAQSK